MGKIVKIAATVVGAVALIATGVGAVVGAAAVTAALGGISATMLTVAAGVLSVGASLLNKPKSPEIGAAARDRLNVSLDVRTPRKMVFGNTAFATDLRDQEFTGTDKEYLHRFFVCAAHEVENYQQIWFDDKLAWTSGGGVQGDFVGYLTVSTRTAGTAANAINISARMGNTRRFTGLAYVYMRFKLTGNSKKTESPFAQSVPSRMTIIGDGIPCYDPRQDSTQPGGAGTHRADDQTTWTYGPHAENPACQLLTYMLGWRIQNPQSLTWKLSCGKGIPPDRIDMASFMESANLCDEPVALSGGGTEKRYVTGGIFTEGDSPIAVVDTFKAAMNADLDDVDGLLRLTVFHNDLATPVADFGMEDIEGDYLWQQTPSLADSFNVVRGTYIEPDTKSLYQPNEYEEQRLASRDGIDRIHQADYGLVQKKSRAERLSKQRLQRQQYGGTFRAVFLASAWKVEKNSIVRLTFPPEGFVNKLFRVVETAVQQDGRVPMVLREEHEDIYAWDQEEGPPVVIADPTDYSVADTPYAQFLDGVEEGATAGAQLGTDVTDENGNVVSDVDAITNQGISLGFVGQGPLATSALAESAVSNANISLGSSGEEFFLVGGGTGVNVNLLGLGFTGDKDATFGSRMGTSLFRNDGSTIAFEADVVTLQGISSGIVGQGTGATANTLSQLNAAEGDKLLNIDPGVARSQNLLQNGDLADADTSMFNFTGSASVIAGAASDPGARKFSLAASNSYVLFNRGTSNASTTTGIRPVQPGEPLWFVVVAKTVGSSPGSLRFSNFVYDGALSYGGAYTTSYFPLTSGWAVHVIKVITPATSTGGNPIAYARFRMQRVGGTSGSIEVAKAYVTNVEPGATIGASLGTNLYSETQVLLGNSDVVTGEGISLGFVGQGALATREDIDLTFVTDAGALAGEDYAALGSRVTREDGVTLLTDAVAVTILGTAAAIVGQAAAATDSTIEASADVTKSLTGTNSIKLAYDSSGAIKAGETPKLRTYSLVTSGGSVISSGVTWSVSTLSGTWSGTAPSISGTGTGQLSINSGLATSSATVQVKATYSGREYVFNVEVSKDQDPPEISTATQASKSISGTVTTTWGDVSGELVFSTGAASTSASLTAANVSIDPTSYGTTGNGAATVEMRWVWWNGSSWVVVGTADASSPHPAVFDEGFGIITPNSGSVTSNETKTGLSSNTEYRFKVQARIASTSGTNTITQVSLSGTASGNGG